MKTLRYSFLCAALAGSLVSGFSAETIYHPSPTGNSASLAAPRDDWYADVQRKFDRFGGKPADIVFDGDSIMNRWEDTGRPIWSLRYAAIAADFGIEGDRVENVLWRLGKGQLDGIDPKVVVLMIGTNNSGRNSADEIAEGIKVLVAEYEKRCPNAQIILMGIFPRGRTPDDGGRLKVAAVNAKIKQLGGTGRVTYLDLGPKMIEADGTISPEMMPDSVHPTLKGYQIWAEAIQPVIDQYIAKK
jgi:lysophospholipase L1-like esterase